MKLLVKLFTDRDFFFFCGIGALSALSNFLSFFVFFHLLKLQYEVSVSCAYVLSVCVHFLGNRHVTFKRHRGKLWPQLVRYLCMVGVNYLVTLFVAFGVVHWLHLPPYMGVVAAIAATVGVGFLMAKKWVFISQENKTRY